MAKLTLDHLRAQAKEKFDDLVVEVSEDEQVVFQHVARLAKADRTRILALVDEVTKDDEDEDKSSDAVDKVEKLYHQILTSVANDKNKAKALLKQLDVPELTVLFESWISGTKLGEASSSQS